MQTREQTKLSWMADFFLIIFNSLLRPKFLKVSHAISTQYYVHAILNLDNCRLLSHYGRPWPAVYINFVQIKHQIQVLTEPLCRAQAIFYALPNSERGTKYRGVNLQREAKLSPNL